MCCFRRGRFSKVQVGPIHFCVFFSYLQIFFRFFFFAFTTFFFFCVDFWGGVCGNVYKLYVLGSYRFGIVVVIRNITVVGIIFAIGVPFEAISFGWCPIHGTVLVVRLLLGVVLALIGGISIICIVINIFRWATTGLCCFLFGHLASGKRGTSTFLRRHYRLLRRAVFLLPGVLIVLIVVIVLVLLDGCSIGLWTTARTTGGYVASTATATRLVLWWTTAFLGHLWLPIAIGLDSPLLGSSQAASRARYVQVDGSSRRSAHWATFFDAAVAVVVLILIVCFERNKAMLVNRYNNEMNPGIYLK